MLRARVIPCLLLDGVGLVKTTRFRNPSYVGDPINALRIFNEKEVDELILLDIGASRVGTEPQFDLIRSIVSEAFMPVAYGGGISSVVQAKRLIATGVEKVIVNSAALRYPDLIGALSREIGASSTVAAIDVGRDPSGGYRLFNPAQRRLTDIDPQAQARRAVAAGAGEIFINDVDRDGTGDGYDLDLIKQIALTVSVPAIICGGAGQLSDLKLAVNSGAAAVAAGSMFVYIGKHRAVMINYPKYEKLRELLSDD